MSTCEDTTNSGPLPYKEGDCVRFFPVNPKDGDTVLDCSGFRRSSTARVNYGGVRWIFNSELKEWVQIGTTSDNTIASIDRCGIISAQDKALIDGTPTAPGGFGILIDNREKLKTHDNPHGVISGNISIVSDSITIVSRSGCSNGQVIENDLEYVDFKVSDKFKSSFIFDHRGPTGEKGDKGLDGLEGKPGFCPDGPKGYTGLTGDPSGPQCVISKIVYNDIDDITSEGYVDLKILKNDGLGCKMVLTKAPLNIEQVANKVIAAPITRFITVADCFSVTIGQSAGDNTILDPFVARVPKGAASSTVELNAVVKLSQLL